MFFASLSISILAFTTGVLSLPQIIESTASASFPQVVDSTANAVVHSTAVISSSVAFANESVHVSSSIASRAIASTAVYPTVTSGCVAPVIPPGGCSCNLYPAGTIFSSVRAVASTATSAFGSVASSVHFNNATVGSTRTIGSTGVVVATTGTPAVPSPTGFKCPDGYFCMCECAPASATAVGSATTLFIESTAVPTIHSTVVS